MDKELKQMMELYEKKSEFADKLIIENIELRNEMSVLRQKVLDLRQQVRDLEEQIECLGLTPVSRQKTAKIIAIQ